MEKANLNLSSLLLLPAGHDLCNILEYKTIVFLVAVALLEKGVHHSVSYRIERNLRDCKKVSSEKETLALSVKRRKTDFSENPVSCRITLKSLEEILHCKEDFWDPMPKKWVGQLGGAVGMLDGN